MPQLLPANVTISSQSAAGVDFSIACSITCADHALWCALSENPPVRSARQCPVVTASRPNGSSPIGGPRDRPSPALAAAAHRPTGPRAAPPWDRVRRSRGFAALRLSARTRLGNDRGHHPLAEAVVRQAQDGRTREPPGARRGPTRRPGGRRSVRRSRSPSSRRPRMVSTPRRECRRVIRPNQPAPRTRVLRQATVARGDHGAAEQDPAVVADPHPRTVERDAVVDASAARLAHAVGPHDPHTRTTARRSRGAGVAAPPRMTASRSASAAVASGGRES